jgi:hypothetical protein
MKRGSKFLIVALSTFAMAGTAVAQGDGGDTGDGTGDATGDGTGDAGTGDAGTGDAGTGDAGTGDAGGDMGGDAGGDMGADMGVEGEGGMPLVLPKGKFAISAGIDINLSKDAVGKPISITPDVFYGVIPKLEVGVAHSGYALSGFWGGGLGGGICIGDGCFPDKVYDGKLGVLARYLLVDGKLAAAADVGVLIGSFDPFLLGAKIGVRGRYTAGKIMIGFAPNVKIGITERDAGNKEVLSVPVDLMFAATPKIMAGLQTGIAGPFSGFGDAYVIPISVGGLFMATPNITAGLAFNIYSVNRTDADARGITVFFGYHN